MRKIPFKNYIILFVIAVSTIIVSLLLSRNYQNRRQDTSILYKFLPSITLNDLDTYLIENDITVIYIDDKYNKADNKEEKKLKEKIIEYNLNHKFVFLDSSSITSEFIESFNIKYQYNFKEHYPMVMIMNQKRVIKTYYELDVTRIPFEDLK